MKITKRQLRRIIREVVENQLSIDSVPNMIQSDIPGAAPDPIKKGPGNPDNQWYTEDLSIKLPSRYSLWAEFTNQPDTFYNNETGEYYRGSMYYYTFWVHHPNEGGSPFAESPGGYSDISEIYPMFVDHAKEVIQKRNEDPSYGEYN